MRNQSEELFGRRTRGFSSEHLRNSTLIFTASLINAALGFFFWFLVARHYHVNDVGVATTVTSLIALALLFSRLGLNFSLIRFLPHGNTSSIFSTVMIVTTVFSLILALPLLALLLSLSEEILIFRTALGLAVVIGLLVSASGVEIIGLTAIALRRTLLYVLINLMLGFRLMFVVPFVTMGALGIVISYFLSSFIALAVGALLLLKIGIRFRISVDYGFLRDSASYSLGNYLSNLLMTASSSVIPLMVFAMLGPSDAAFYYVGYTITSMLFMVPSAITISMFVEGSHGISVRRLAVESSIWVLVMLGFAIFALWLMAEPILQALGKDYAVSSLPFVRVMSLASLALGMNHVLVSARRIQKRTKELVLVGLLVFLLSIGLSYIWIKAYGLIGVACAWIVAYAAATCFGLLPEFSRRRTKLV